MKVEVLTTLKAGKDKWRKGLVFDVPEIGELPAPIRIELSENTGTVRVIEDRVPVHPQSDKGLNPQRIEPGLTLTDNEKDEIVGHKSWSKTQILRLKKDAVAYLLWEKFPDIREMLAIGGLTRDELIMIAEGRLVDDTGRANNASSARSKRSD